MKRTVVLNEIKATSAEELKNRLERLRGELFQHRMKKATNQLKNTMSIRALRKEIAQVLTVMSQRKSSN